MAQAELYEIPEEQSESEYLQINIPFNRSAAQLSRCEVP
jgi:hypothetical protein